MQSLPNQLNVRLASYECTEYLENDRNAVQTAAAASRTQFMIQLIRSFPKQALRGHGDDGTQREAVPVLNFDMLYHPGDQRGNRDCPSFEQVFEVACI